MIDIDETARRIYKNPYEAETKPRWVCRWCGRGIYAGDTHRKTYGGYTCRVCVEKQR